MVVGLVDLWNSHQWEWGNLFDPLPVPTGLLHLAFYEGLCLVLLYVVLPRKVDVLGRPLFF